MYVYNKYCIHTLHHNDAIRPCLDHLSVVSKTAFQTSSTGHHRLNVTTHQMNSTGIQRVYPMWLHVVLLLLEYRSIVACIIGCSIYACIQSLIVDDK